MRLKILEEVGGEKNKPQFADKSAFCPQSMIALELKGILSDCSLVSAKSTLCHVKYEYMGGGWGFGGFFFGKVYYETAHRSCSSCLLKIHA